MESFVSTRFVHYHLHSTSYNNRYLHPTGNQLAESTINYYDVPTPHIQSMLDDGGIIIPRTYAGGPKCSPSRFSILTGRYPTRGKFAVSVAEKGGTLHLGTTVSVPSTALWGDDLVYSVFNTLHNAYNPYYTGMVGKWYVPP